MPVARTTVAKRPRSIEGGDVFVGAGEKPAGAGIGAAHAVHEGIHVAAPSMPRLGRQLMAALVRPSKSRRTPLGAAGEGARNGCGSYPSNYTEKPGPLLQGQAINGNPIFA